MWTKATHPFDTESPSLPVLCHQCHGRSLPHPVAPGLKPTRYSKAVEEMPLHRTLRIAYHKAPIYMKQLPDVSQLHVVLGKTHIRNQRMPIFNKSLGQRYTDAQLLYTIDIVVKLHCFPMLHKLGINAGTNHCTAALLFAIYYIQTVGKWWCHVSQSTKGLKQQTNR